MTPLRMITWLRSHNVDTYVELQSIILTIIDADDSNHHKAYDTASNKIKD